MAMLDVPTVSHQVALSGIVTDLETSARLVGVTATITSMPTAFQSFLSQRALRYGAGWATLDERPDRTSTGGDGSFAFVDLPDGAYVVTFSAPRSVGLYGGATAPFTVARDAEGRIALSPSQVSLPPTAVRGVVNGVPPGSGTGGVAGPIVGARVRVQGSGETAHTGSDGSFYLPDVEPGTRTLEMTAPNYVAVTTPVVIVLGTITDAGTVTLTPS